jgi:hypothetical protein
LPVAVHKGVYVLCCRERVKRISSSLLNDSGYEVLSFPKEDNAIKSEVLSSIAVRRLQEEILMPELKKVAKSKSISKPKIVKAKPAAKPKAKATSKSAAKPVVFKAPEVKAPVAKKTRAYTRKPKGSFADLIKKQAELEEIKKGAKADLRKQYENHLKEADKVKAQYQELFHELLLASVKGKSVVPRKSAKGGYTLDQVQAYIDQSSNGGK